MALRSTTPNNVRETREETISRDVGRTFPKHQQFRDSGGLGQRSLYHKAKVVVRTLFWLALENQ